MQANVHNSSRSLVIASVACLAIALPNISYTAFILAAVPLALYASQFFSRSPVSLPIRLSILSICLIAGVIATQRGWATTRESVLFVVPWLTLFVREHNAALTWFVVALLFASASLIKATDGWAYALAVGFALALGSALLQLHTGGTYTNAVRMLLRRSLRIETVASIVFIIALIMIPKFYKEKRRYNSGNMFTGFSASLRPDLVSNLRESNRVLFRAKLDKPMASDQLYWRGAVLTSSDGLVWTRGLLSENLPDVPIAQGVDLIRQDITLEQGTGRFLFTLGNPISIHAMSADQNIVRKYGDTLFANDTRNYRREYQVVASRSPQATALTALEAKALRMPPNIVTSATKALVNELVPRGTSVQQGLQNILQWYTRNNFRYSTKLGEPVTSIDQFLFKVRAGFCEHYAGTTATLLRLAGFPTRVVVGFHGGQLNRIGGYYQVRDRDAHAWLEAWDSASQTWLRVDPTSILAPETLADTAAGDWYAEFSDVAVSQWYQIARVFESQVAEDVIQYFYDQTEVLDTSFVIGITCFLSAIAVALYRRWRRRYPKMSPVARLYQSFCASFAARGVNKLPHEAPLAYAQRCAEQSPSLAEPIAAFTHLFVEAHYKAQATDVARAVKLMQNELRKLT